MSLTDEEIDNLDGLTCSVLIAGHRGWTDIEYGADHDVVVGNPPDDVYEDIVPLPHQNPEDAWYLQIWLNEIYDCGVEIVKQGDPDYPGEWGAFVELYFGDMGDPDIESVYSCSTDPQLALCRAALKAIVFMEGRNKDE